MAIGREATVKQQESTIRSAVFKAFEHKVVNHTVPKLSTIIRSENISTVMITRLVVPTPEYEQSIKFGLNSGIFSDEPIDCPDLRRAFSALEQSASWEIAVTAGLETIVRPLFGNNSFATNEFMRHALATSAGCAVIADHLGLPHQQLVVAGLFHNIGVAVLVNSAPEIYNDFFEHLSGSNLTLEELELAEFGFTHESAGEAFMLACLFPDSTWRSAASHHQNDNTNDLVVGCVRLCSNIAHKMGCTLGLANACNPLHPSLISDIGLNEITLSQIANRMAIAAVRGTKYT